MFWGFISLSSVNADVTQGLEYLSTQQTAEDSFSNEADISTEFQATSETLRAFQFASDTVQTGSDAALDFLNTVTDRNTENLSRLIIANAEAGNDVQGLVDELIDRQNSDGGFGDSAGYDSTVLDTAFALEALSVSEQAPTSSTAAAVYFLIDEQLAEGGWAGDPNDPTVYLSALAMHALWHYRGVFSGVDSALAQAQDFLLDQRNIGTGLWSETFESALALIAIIPNVNEFSQISSTVTELQNQQQANGSWDNSVYATALAVRALASQPISLPSAATVGEIKGKVLDSVTHQPINGAVVSIGSINVNATTDLNGEFSVQDLDAGTYSLSFGATGYAEAASTSVTVMAGTETVLADTLLSPLPTSGVLQGAVTDAETGQALAGVLVTVSGSSTGSTSTASNGNFSLTGLDPGNITITLTLSGYLPVTATATVIAGNTVVFNPAMTPSTAESVPLAGTVSTGLLRGQVTDAGSSSPLAFARVSVDDASTGARLKFVFTGSDGSYEIADLNPGAILIQISKSEYVTVAATATVQAGNALTFSPALIPEEGNTADVNEETLPSTPTTGVLKGQVTDADTGSPLDSVGITVDDAGTGSRLKTIYTGTDGTYVIEGLEPGAVVIQASKSGYLAASATATVQAGNALVFNPGLVPEGGDPDSGTSDIDEEPLPEPTTGTLKGQVTDAENGTPLETAKVAVDDEDTGERLKTVFTGADGSYEITDLEPGDIFIQVSKTGFVSAVANATVQPGVALLFDPALIPEEENLDGEVDEEPLPDTATTGELQGVVTDAEAGLALSGASIGVTGSISATTISATDGTYAIQDITPGEITVTVSLAGYLSVTATGSVAAGNAIVFNPALPPDDYIGSDPGRIVGRVVEAGSLDPMRYVVVEADGDAGLETMSTGSDGEFEFTDLSPGNYTIRFESSAYIERSLSVVVTSGGTVDLQDVELSSASGTAAVFGQITDAETSAPINGAVVSIMGTAISTQTDDDGNYRIEGLEPGSKTITFSATGYNSQTMIYGLLQPGEFEFNRALTLTENSDLNITFLSTDRSVYSAYTAGEIHANVLNNGSPIEAMVVFSLFDEYGELNSEFTAKRQGEQGTLIMLEPGVIDSVAAAFNTANLPPGEYRIVGRVLVGNQMIGPATAILAERTTDFIIEETAVITQLDIDPIPEFSAVGVTETVTMLAAIVNRSNVPVNLQFTYNFLSPGGVAIRTSSTISIELQPEQDNLSQIIDTFSPTFSEAGEHSFTVSFQNSVVPDTLQTGVISVAPGLRIDPSQSLTPTSVTPDEDQRIRINIRLEGREVQ